MQHFFVDASQVSEETIRIEGSDVNHMKNVLRMRIGEEVTVSDGQGKEYLCQVRDFEEEQVQLKIVETKASDAELPSKIYLFQGLPKQEKMELIVQNICCYNIIFFISNRILNSLIVNDVSDHDLILILRIPFTSIFS